MRAVASDLSLAIRSVVGGLMTQKRTSYFRLFEWPLQRESGGLIATDREHLMKVKRASVILQRAMRRRKWRKLLMEKIPLLRGC